ncbi:leukocyte cysteine proteinase inhibitor 1-like [Hemitrygon akajei]|uniref:leukocyte cysteine proteinase inhibitor 1-like n=1 Tax=Hemitrygon akajei TaxID=2704970 RepID=UPI003BF9911D
MPAWSGPLTADPTVQEYANEVKDVVQKKIQVTMIKYMATLYRKQEQTIMTGKMFLIKVDIGIPANFLHLEVFVPGGSPCILLAVEENHNVGDTMEPLI